MFFTSGERELKGSNNSEGNPEELPGNIKGNINSDFIDAIKSAISSVKSDIAVVTIIVATIFLAITITITFKRDISIYEIISIYLSYIAVVAILSFSMFATHRHRGLDLLEDLRRSIAENTQQVNCLQHALSGDLKYADMKALGKIDVQDQGTLKSIWSSIIGRSTKSLLFVNYIGPDFIESGTFSGVHELTNLRRADGGVHVSRIFLVDDIKEAERIWPTVLTHKEKNISPGYVVKSDLSTIMRNNGFSLTDWNYGFIIADDIEVIVFEMAERKPRWVYFVRNGSDTKRYKDLYAQMTAIARLDAPATKKACAPAPTT
ncbi:hypothetical protein [Azospirillum lipoferum]|nr:hypothetical protein [Azospirillum lipoferum]